MTITDVSYKVDNIVDELFVSFDRKHIEEVLINMKLMTKKKESSFFKSVCMLLIRQILPIRCQLTMNITMN
jgi:hypothetical protein